MIANEFLLITNESGLPQEAARIGLNRSLFRTRNGNPSGVG